MTKADWVTLIALAFTLGAVGAFLWDQWLA